MADSKLSDLQSITTVGSSDIVYVVSNNASKKITIDRLANTLPSIGTTSNVNISGNISIPGGQTIFYGGEDYATAYVLEQLEAFFTPLTGNGLTVQSTDYTVASANNNTVLLSAVSGHQSFSYGDRLRVTVPNIGNYGGHQISFIQGDTAWIEFVPSAGVTINSINSSLTAQGPYSKVDLIYLGDQQYLLTGNLSAAS